jgi:hypothetical protein
MKKPYLLLLLMIATLHIVKAQTNVTGSVKDDKGTPLHYVFIEDTQYKIATFSDSLGNFTIALHPDSKVQFELAGYDSATAANGNNANFQIVLKAVSATSNNSPSQSSLAATGMVLQRPNNIPLGMLPGHQKGNVHGNRYLFDNFVHGYFINSFDNLAHSKDFLFDYDKMDGGLLLTKDNANVMQMSWDQIKAFTLFSNRDETFNFEKVPSIDISHYMQVLSSGKKYKIYKLIKTKLVRADYVNTGVTQHGNDFDEYVDDADYYVLDLQGNQPQKLSLKKKSIKEDFAKEADKVNKYLSDNSGRIDDVYLSKLGAYMNQ